MILFFISFILVTLSSYLITSVFAPKKRGVGLIYLFLTMFAQVVLTFEVLSIFSAIGKTGVLVINALFLAAAATFWQLKGRPLYLPRVKKTFSEMFKIFKKDRILCAMGIGFLFFVTIAIIMNTFLPINSYDALNYHMARVPFWLSNGNLLHFDMPDDRAIVFPINSELLYTWILTFMKEDWGIGFFSFAAYLVSCVVLFNITGLFGFSKRRSLWSVFVFGALASILSQATSSETDLLVGSLVFSSIFLFVFALKENKTPPLFFSALAYALAIGTKTPAIIAIPACALLLIFFAALYKKKNFYKPLLIFIGFGILNFILFASFNYILNLINYGNPMGNFSTIESHKFFGGPAAFISNYIKYMFMFIDFSGYRYGEYIGLDIINFRNTLLLAMGINPKLGVIVPEIAEIIKETLDVKMGAGLLGFMLYLPCLFIALFKPLCTKNAKKSLLIMAFAAVFFINLAVLSFTLGYMIFSIRFITFFMVISSPVLVWSYFKRTGILKMFFLFLVLSYYVIVSTNLSGKPFVYLNFLYNKYGKNIYTIRERMRCSDTLAYDSSSAFCQLKVEILNNFKKNAKIGVFSSLNSRVYIIKMLEKRGYKVDILLIEKLDDYNLKSYDYLITTDQIQESAMIHKYPEGLENYHLTPDYKIKFKPNHYGRCVYKKHNGSVIVGSKNVPVSIQPAFVECRIPDFFYPKIGFKHIKTIKIETKFDQNNNVFEIYENTN